MNRRGFFGKLLAGGAAAAAASAGTAVSADKKALTMPLLAGETTPASGVDFLARQVGHLHRAVLDTNGRVNELVRARVTSADAPLDRWGMVTCSVCRWQLTLASDGERTLAGTPDDHDLLSCSQCRRAWVVPRPRLAGAVEVPYPAPASRGACVTCGQAVIVGQPYVQHGPVVAVSVNGSHVEDYVEHEACAQLRHSAAARGLIDFDSPGETYEAYVERRMQQRQQEQTEKLRRAFDDDARRQGEQLRAQLQRMTGAPDDPRWLE